VIVVRHLRSDDDLVRLGDIVREAYVNIPDYPPDPDYDVTLERVGERAAEARIIVADDGGELVGCLTFVDDTSSHLFEYPDRSLVCIRMFGVDGTRQGAGVGRTMLQWCIDETHRLGRAGIGLHTIAQMTSAIRLYERFGFVRMPQYDEEFYGATGLAYELRL
jgi:GNAT superfamily N-acetyltransferase